MARTKEKISLSVIAKELGVSPSTVSRVINERTGVDEETRKRVFLRLKKYNYRTSYSRCYRDMIGIVTDSVELCPYFSDIVSGANIAMKELGFASAMIFHDQNSGEPLLQTLRNRQCAAAILANVSVAESGGEFFTGLAESGLPVVIINRTVECKGVGYVSSSCTPGYQQLAEHLASLGHRNIGILAGNQNQPVHRHRLETLLDILRSRNFCCPDSHVVLPPSSWSPMRDGYLQLPQLLKREPSITAIIAFNDEVAQGAISAAVKMGLRIPQDLSIVGFDDYPSSAYLNPALTTISLQMREMGLLAVKSIADVLKSNHRNELVRLTLPTELRIRDSTAAAAQRKKL